MSWSYRITILYLGFVGLIVSLVTISSQNKEELVSKDYYAQELLFQAKLDAINNEKRLEESISHQVDVYAIRLTAPEAMLTNIEGEIYFFCPSNSSHDKKVKMKFNSSGQMVIEKSKLSAGIYKMRLSWKSNATNYYREEIVTIK